MLIAYVTVQVRELEYSGYWAFGIDVHGSIWGRIEKLCLGH